MPWYVNWYFPIWIIKMQALYYAFIQLNWFQRKWRRRKNAKRRFWTYLTTDSNGGSWMLGPPLLIGDRVFYTGDSGRVRVSGDNLAFIPGVVKWMGRIQECFGNQMIAGVALVSILLNNQASRLRPTHSIPALSDFQGSKLITSLLIFLGIILLHSKEIPQSRI